MSMASMGIGYTDDPVRDAERYYSALDDNYYANAKPRHKCAGCGCELHKEAFKYNDKYFCEDCILDITYVEFDMEG